MLNFYNTKNKNFERRLKIILDLRKKKQSIKSSLVKKILLDVYKFGDKAVLKYEKKLIKN